MDSSVYLPLIAALGGALLGSATSIATILIQSGRDERRHLREVAADLALDDYKTHVELAKTQRGGPIYPIVIYFAHHMRVLEAAAAGKLTSSKLAEIGESDRKLRAVIDEARKAAAAPRE